MQILLSRNSTKIWLPALPLNRQKCPLQSLPKRMASHLQSNLLNSRLNSSPKRNLKNNFNNLNSLLKIQLKSEVKRRTRLASASESLRST